MPRQPRWVHGVLAVVSAVVLAGVAGCGQDSESAEARAQQALEKCHDQWREVGDTVVDMDEDPNPSALAERWTTVIATVDYYRTADSAKGCDQAVENQLRGIAALRLFSEKLRPYDMTYQLSQVRAAIDVYLHAPLPTPVRGDDGKLVQPPSKASVAAAMETLSAHAVEANAELAPGWEQTKSVDLTDVDALTATMQDLDFLAQDSPHWRRCEEALQVLVAAIRAQEGLAEAPSTNPTDATTPAG